MKFTRLPNYNIHFTAETDELIPYKKHQTDAGWDLKSKLPDFTLHPGGQIKIPTGIRIAIPRSFAGMIFPRSGLGTKYRVRLANTVGIIDSDYRGEIIVFLTNEGKTELKIYQYDRFCQLLIVPVVTGNLIKKETLPSTIRGEGGFGHTGVKHE